MRNDNGVCSDKFDLEEGLRQGCVLSPLLFNIFPYDLALQQTGCEGIKTTVDMRMPLWTGKGVLIGMDNLKLLKRIMIGIMPSVETPLHCALHFIVSTSSCLLSCTSSQLLLFILSSFLLFVFFLTKLGSFPFASVRSCFTATRRLADYTPGYFIFPLLPGDKAPNQQPRGGFKS